MSTKVTTYAACGTHEASPAELSPSKTEKTPREQAEANTALGKAVLQSAKEILQADVVYGPVSHAIEQFVDELIKTLDQAVPHQGKSNSSDAAHSFVSHVTPSIFVSFNAFEGQLRFAVGGFLASSARQEIASCINQFNVTDLFTAMQGHSLEFWDKFVERYVSHPIEKSLLKRRLTLCVQSFLRKYVLPELTHVVANLEQNSTYPDICSNEQRSVEPSTSRPEPVVAWGK